MIMMKFFKRVICAVLLVAGLCACIKLDVGKLEGSWTEQYDPSVLAMDSFAFYTFDGSNGYQLHVYHALGGGSQDFSGHYDLDRKNKTITINSTISGEGDVTYKIVKLTSEEMAWQKVGTTYSVNGWGTDYRHFVRSSK